MTHEEYLVRVEILGDSPEDVNGVLAHAGSCATCRKEQHSAEEALSRLEPQKRSLTEEVARWSAAAAILVLVVLGIHKEVGGAGSTGPPAKAARYLIVGDASGVVAYTPEGIVVGVAPRSRLSEKEVVK